MAVLGSATVITRIRQSCGMMINDSAALRSTVKERQPVSCLQVAVLFHLR